MSRFWDTAQTKIYYHSTRCCYHVHSWTICYKPLNTNVSAEWSHCRPC